MLHDYYQENKKGSLLAAFGLYMYSTLVIYNL